jgi:hypothetical protein
VAVAESRSQSHSIPFLIVRGYITITYEDHWWLGCVLEKYKENKNLKSDSFIHMDHQPPVFPSQRDELILPISLIMSMVTPTSETERTYKLSSAEASHIPKLLEDFKMM